MCPAPLPPPRVSRCPCPCEPPPNFLHMTYFPKPVKPGQPAIPNTSRNLLRNRQHKSHPLPSFPTNSLPGIHVFISHLAHQLLLWPLLDRPDIRARLPPSPGRGPPAAVSRSARPAPRPLHCRQRRPADGRGGPAPCRGGYRRPADVQRAGWRE